jgi:DNA-binding NarL/FixJ family response regulator
VAAHLLEARPAGEGWVVEALRAARLAARGLSNPEIAEVLFVTAKTVQFHLSNAYRKLGIESRRELPGALPREGP